METSTKASLQELCELVRKEEDPSKLLELVQEINRMLDKSFAKETGALSRQEKR